ncbi:MAG: NUDIX domain-containing protein [Helicobacter sp.]|uniref:NUDIX domain-containing protein n=1 Tax=Helicobacter sp. TaxID=218 RepID=UPI002A912907|nr:NUDIX domain-containing protein [Helicobacter sp.]MDY5821293.1 NUDIX domain-containing protein [Helicobacter sp.]MDY5949761.1 NUDIX domain-containing protein [Helicobacter sp.]
MPTNMLYYKGQNTPLPLPNTPEILSISPLTTSKYLQLQQVRFKENNDIKVWDIANANDSVAILLYNRDKDGFILVRQFRVSVFLKNPLHGFMYELCAGLCDKDISPDEIAVQEIQEECGYHVEANKLVLINQFYSSVGMNGARQYLFYAEVGEQDRVSEGGGNKDEQEYIDIIFVPRGLIHEFLQDSKCPTTQSFVYAILWFERQKFPTRQENIQQIPKTELDRFEKIKELENELEIK